MMFGFFFSCNPEATRTKTRENPKGKSQQLMGIDGNLKEEKYSVIVKMEQSSYLFSKVSLSLFLFFMVIVLVYIDML